MPRVLLIENELIFARPAIRLLEQAGARAVDWAPTADTARAVAGTNRYDIVVTDFDLGPSEPTGVELIDELRDTHPQATFVVISGSPRRVPDGVAFVDKMNSEGLTAVVEAWPAPT